MRNLIPSALLLVVSATIHGAEIQFDYNQFALNEVPRGFRSALSGQGKPGEWKIVLDEVPPLLAPLTPNAPSVTKRQVLAQLSVDSTDERFPLLLYDEATFADFKLTTRFRIVTGTVEQMAGIAFRIQDAKNYYYVRASSLGNSFKFFKVVDGVRSPPIGPETEILKGIWHELTVECKGNQIQCALNGKELIPTLTDNSFSSGKIGYWTKSDSISYFADTKIVYTPREGLSAALIREALQKYPRLIGLKIFATTRGKSEPIAIASSEPKDIGLPAEKLEQDVITRGVTYYGKGKQSVTVTLPLHDRNGESIAAVRVTMKSFLGETEQNAVARAMPIIKQMETRIRSSNDLLE